MPFGRRPHERRLTAARLGGVDIGAVTHQVPHRLEAACSGSDHDRRLAVPSRRAGIAAGGQQPIDERRIAIGRRQRHRRLAVFIGGVCAGAGIKQRFRHAPFAEMHRPRERGGAVGLRRIHVDLCPQQRRKLFVVAALDGFEQAQVELLGVERGQRHPRADAAEDSEQENLEFGMRNLECVRDSRVTGNHR